MDKVSSGITVTNAKGKASGYCYGCGADLVNGKSKSTNKSSLMQTVSKKKGFWADKKDELRKSKIKNWALCPRCKQLKKMEKATTSSGGSSNIDLEALEPDSQMTQAFRDEVSKIRTKEKAVVVLCVDAINISGSIIKSIRKYVGGNPILLAVTRCDLLPDYVWKRHTIDDGKNKHDSGSNGLEVIKAIFRKRAADIAPAEVYLCSEDTRFRRTTAGIQELTSDLWQHLNGRDVYVVGTANIGKSTLTDILIAKLAGKGEKAEHFVDRLSAKRLEALKRSRVTKSSLPGTTLQNVRVPCFKDHTQALWDTPGLLIDGNVNHFPIRNFREIRAKRPSQIQPQIWEESELKAFALLICEKGDNLPFMRVEVRLKKGAKGDGPIRLVWNSIFNVETKIVKIPQAIEDERQRAKAAEDEKERLIEEQRDREQAREHLSKEEKDQLKIERRKEHEEKVKREKEELGLIEWEKREKRRVAELEEHKRSHLLAQLTEVHKVVLERNVGTDISVAHFGWLGVLAPRTCLVKTYAANTGVRVSHHPTLALPIEWGEYVSENLLEYSATEEDKLGNDMDDNDSDSDDGNEYEYDKWNEEDALVWDDEYVDWDEISDYAYAEDPLQSMQNRFGFVGEDENEETQDVWAKFSGKHVGWQFDPDGRYLREGLEEGWNPIRRSTDDKEE